jgi:FkbM family methyltransferase
MAIARFLRRPIKNVAEFPIRMLPAGARAAALERMVDRMVTTVPVARSTLVFYSPTPALIARARSVLTKEPDTIAWIDGFGENQVLWDIGANVGAFSVYAAATNQTSVLSFEPSAANYYVLNRNIQLNSLSSRIHAYPVAFSDHTGLGSLNLSTVAMGGSLSQFGNIGELPPYVESQAPAAIQAGLGFSVDDFISIFRAPFPNHLKIDVDGIELSILRGAADTLRDPRLKSLIVEINMTAEHECRSTLNLLRESGLRLATRGPEQVAGGQIAANHLFERV